MMTLLEDYLIGAQIAIERTALQQFRKLGCAIAFRSGCEVFRSAESLAA
jgi:hypothetical protein